MLRVVALFLGFVVLFLFMGCGSEVSSIDTAYKNSVLYGRHDCSELLILGRERDFELGSLVKTMRTSGIKHDVVLSAADSGTFGASSLFLGDGVEADYVNRFGQVIGEYGTIRAIMIGRGCSEADSLRGSRDIVESVELF